MRASRLPSLMLLVVSAMVLASCARKPNELETSFVGSCAGTGANKARCQCTYDAVHKHYGDKRMAEFNNGHSPEDFPKVLAASMTQCVGK
jgi:hypothetical protein